MNQPAGDARFSRLLGELHAPELLVLSLLYHDVGKWTDDDHTIESSRMAHAMLERLDLDADSRAEVDFLVREHIKMSLVAFRRDTEDPKSSVSSRSSSASKNA